MKTPLRHSIAQVLMIARAGGRSLRQRIWSTLTASRADLLKTLAQSRPRSYGASDAFLTLPYRPILARPDCHDWLSVRRPERRLSARLSRALHTVGKSRLRPSRQAAKPYVYASATLVVNARICRD
jgi:hypothetical protein